MGNELNCTLRHEGKSFTGKALLESNEILFRGETRLKIPLTAIKSIQANDGELHVKTENGISIFEIGPQDANWRQKILNPKSVLEKLGIKPAQSASVIGNFQPDFFVALKKHGAAVTRNKIAKDVPWIFFLADQPAQLTRVPAIAKSIRGVTALWLVYPKGQKAITESDVRSAGLKSGLVDIKVVSFSPTHTALKFVLPKSKR
ncbi:MAG TPA: hypothetical protein VMH89_14590 [Candidatus Acidoferrum sp.]|nr:hypothetical protein [Candidatus Acidoferrum sp.]